MIHPMRAPSATAPESCYLTPQWFLARIVGGPFGGLPIQLDPCTTSDNPVKAVRYFTPAEDGLAQFWTDDRVFVNPPFVKAEQWAKKAIKESQRPHRPKIVFLGPAAVGTAWFHGLWEVADDALFLRKRLSFDGGPKGSPTRGTVLFGLNCILRGMGDLGTSARAA